MVCGRKFLGFFPPRTGCIVLAYAGILSSALVIGWFTHYLSEAEAEYAEALLKDEAEEPERPEGEHFSWEEEKVDYTFGFVCIIAIVTCNFFVHGLFIIFSVFLAIGAHGNMRGLVKAYFVYGFFHFFFMLFLASLHFCVDENLETALVVLTDIFFALCLCGVKAMMDSVSNGHHRPAAARYKP